VKVDKLKLDVKDTVHLSGVVAVTLHCIVAILWCAIPSARHYNDRSWCRCIAHWTELFCW